MKYRDRSTIKENGKWADKKETDYDWHKHTSKNIKRWVAKMPINAIWWKSLSDDDRSASYFYFHYRKRSTYITGIDLSDHSIIKELYEKYKPIPEFKRDLVINDLLKSCL